MGLVEPPPGLTDNRYLEGTAGQPFRINGGPGFGSASDAPKVSADQAKLDAIMAAHPQTAAAPPPPRNVDGLPFVKPPYGMLTAINLDTGDTLWQVPHGDTPDEIKTQSGAQGPQHSQDRAGGQCGRSGHQESGGDGRSHLFDLCPVIRAARCCAPMTRRPASRWAKCGCPRRSRARP